MCESCHRERSVTLLDGLQCCTWCEKYRAECEARWLLKMPSRQARRDYLDGGVPRPNGKLSPGVRGMRGESAVKALEGLALKIWEKEK